MSSDEKCYCKTFNNVEDMMDFINGRRLSPDKIVAITETTDVCRLFYRSRFQLGLYNEEEIVDIL